MTVIAYKSGIFAADTAGWQDDLHVVDVSKILAIRGDLLFAAVGRSDVIEAYIIWMRTPGEGGRPDPVEDNDDFTGVLVDSRGARIVSGRTYHVIGYHRDMVALGPHAEFLYGAMLAGASAEEAVRLAIKHCAFAGGDVQVEELAR